MQSITNVDELRTFSLRLIDDILSEKIKTCGEKEDVETEMLNHINKQISNVINVTKLEMKYKGEETIKFLEYENK